MAENTSAGFKAVWGRLPTVLAPTDDVVKPIYLLEGKGASNVTRGFAQTQTIFPIQRFQE